MNVLALNSSPRPDGRSITALLLHHLVAGMREAGAEVDVVNLREKEIRHCIGCFTCWTKTPGTCIHKDDMTRELYPKWLESDLAVYATPLYHYTMNATLKAFIERTLPVLEPFFVSKGGEISHPLRHPHPRLVFLSVAGFPDLSVFEALSAWINTIYGRHGAVVAEIYRPLSEAMRVPFYQSRIDEILKATKQAGREIIETGKVSSQTLARVQQDVTDDPRTFLEMGNLTWKTCIAEGLSLKEFNEKKCTPRPDSIETFLMVMSAGFNPEAAGDLRAVFQFHFTGDVEGSCHLTVADGEVHGGIGEHPSPDLTVEAPFEIWMDIVTGKAGGGKLFLTRKYHAHGNLLLLKQMDRLFNR